MDSVLEDERRLVEHLDRLVPAAVAHVQVDQRDVVRGRGAAGRMRDADVVRDQVVCICVRKGRRRRDYRSEA